MAINYIPSLDFHITNETVRINTIDDISATTRNEFSYNGFSYQIYNLTDYAINKLITATDNSIVTGNYQPTLINYELLPISLNYKYLPLTPTEKIREIMKKRISPTILVKRKPAICRSELKEVRARATLRRILGEDKFRAFLRNGFISVKSKSGLVYQIFPGQGHTVIIDKGKKIERLCVILTGGFSDIDQMIMRYLLILNDEVNFRAYANISNYFGEQISQPKTDQRPLIEIYRELKAAA